VLNIDVSESRATDILKALASQPRLQILDLLKDRVCNVTEISEALDMPMSTANLHIKGLEAAGLLMTDLRPGARGVQKMCSRVYDRIIIQLPHAAPQEAQAVEVSMPVGAYVDCGVTPTCGLASREGIIGLFDDPASFYEPDRVQAQLLWFHHGHVEYRFPNRLPPNVAAQQLQLSMEICSEAPLHHDHWASDITLWINGVEVGTWTSPRDFGGQRGALTPAWWEDHNSQYGLLKIWQVNHEGSYIDGLHISDVTLDDLGIGGEGFLSVRVGVKSDAENVGGMNLFGRYFGNYPQDIVLRIQY
jgi:predicted transcriptional regulator